MHLTELWQGYFSVIFENLSTNDLFLNKMLELCLRVQLDVGITKQIEAQGFKILVHEIMHKKLLIQVQVQINIE